MTIAYTSRHVLSGARKSSCMKKEARWAVWIHLSLHIPNNTHLHFIIPLSSSPLQYLYSSAHCTFVFISLLLSLSILCLIPTKKSRKYMRKHLYPFCEVKLMLFGGFYVNAGMRSRSV